MAIYTWAPGTQVNVDPQVAGEELERIKNQNNGRLEPQVVVNEASSKHSPLHACFEWNDKTAANHYRKVQARHIVNHIQVEYMAPGDEKPVEIPAFVSMKKEGDEKQSYVGTMDAMADRRMRRLILQRAWNELQIWKNKYLDFKELSRIFEAISSVEDAEIKQMDQSA